MSVRNKVTVNPKPPMASPTLGSLRVGEMFTFHGSLVDNVYIKIEPIDSECRIVLVNTGSVYFRPASAQIARMPCGAIVTIEQA